MSDSIPSLETWREANNIFERLIALDMVARERELKNLQHTRPDIYGEVDRLLNAGPATQAQALLNVEAIGSAGTPGVQFGAYRLESMIGSGGMGEVWLASRADGLFEGHAAVKLLHPYLASSRVRERFAQEGRILGRLQHPHIARLLDAGIGNSGALYLILEYVEGSRIDQYCDAQHLDLHARVRLFMQVCEALAYAHTHLIVHRDLKPSNIMVTRAGEAKLLDFGIAKLLEQQDSDAELTRLGGLALTPEYAAPEQLNGDPVSTATDIYALGLMLYVLLTGRHPYAEHLSHPLKLQQAINETGAPLMSHSAADLSPEALTGLRSATRKQLVRGLQGDLDNIVAKALRREPTRRYVTAQEFAEDLRRYLEHEPVLARAESPLYRLRKFVRRNWIGVTAAAAVAASLIAGVAGVLWQSRIAQTEAAKATAVKDFLIGIFEQSSALNPDGEAARQVTAEQLLDLGAERIRTQLREAPEVRLELLETVGNLYQTVLVNDRAVALRREALEAARALYGDERHPRVLDARTSLASTLIEADQMQTAREMLEQVVRDMDEAGDRGSIGRVHALSQLAYVRYMLESAHSPLPREAALEALELLRRRHAGHPEEGGLLQTLGRIEEQAGKLDESARWYQEALAFADKSDNSLFKADIHEDYGDLMNSRGRDAEAEQHLRKALELFSKATGPESPLTASSETVLANFLNNAGRSGEALPLMQHVVDSLSRSLGPGASRTTDALLELGNAQMARGLLLDAAATFDKATDARAKLDSENNRAVVLVRQLVPQTVMADWQAAEASLKECFRIVIEVYGEGSPSHGVTHMREGELRLAQGRHNEAREVFNKVLAGWPPAAGELPAVYVKPLWGLAEIDTHNGKAAEAEARMRKLLAEVEANPRRKQLADTEAQTLLQLGWALQAAGKAAEAEPLLERALSLRIAGDDPRSLWLARLRLVQSLALRNLGRQADAKIAYQAAAATLDQYPHLAPSYTQLRQQAGKGL